ncbi:RHS repeat-associated core domain-containing protein [Luedemannella flava]
MPATAAPQRLAGAQKDWVTPGHRLARTGVASAPEAAPPTAPPDPVWPAAGVTDVTVPDTAGDTVRAGGGVAIRPLTNRPKAAAGAAGDAVAAGKARVEVFSRAATRAAGVNGVLLRVGLTSPAEKARRAEVSVDYSGFATAYGADWPSRLRLVRLPECALSTPGRPECRGTVLPTDNDVKLTTLTATAEITALTGASSASAAVDSVAVGGGILLAAAGEVSGGAGDYAATTLSPSGTWSAGDSSGNFTWSYPMRTPPALGGAAPTLQLSYSSQSVDGRMAASNNQPSWVGEGFDLATGYIERRYKSCGDDMTNGNNTTKTADLCWATDNATLSLGTHAGDLIKDASNGNRWHLRQDDGTFVYHKTGNTGNGDNDGEWWVVTTPDGVQFWFGGTNASNSTLLVPVAGNQTNEPCNKSTFVASFCAQAWRWNLDRVVDPNGNTMTYSYTKETNKYARNATATDVVSYDRAAFLKRIEYGTRNGVTGTAPMRVTFGDADRCLTDCSNHGANWPDTPWDFECTASPCYTGSPTFWTTRRLKTITTELWSGSATTYNPVTTWTFTHSFPSPNDGTRAGLVLDRIAQTGYVRVQTSVPDITFEYVKLNNRVDPTLTPDHSPPMNWSRLAKIMTESGEHIEVTYAPANCVPGSSMPDKSALQNNTLRCYPVRWTPPGELNPLIDFFHKYVVAEVHEVDKTTKAEPTIVTRYTYVGAPAWHYTDDDGLIKAANKTWSVWRGYGTVRTYTGTGAGETFTESRYFRGMHGDYLTGSTSRTAAMAAIDMNKDGDTSDAVDVAAVNDEDAFAGMVREKISYNGPAGAEVSAEVSVPWQSSATATRTINSTTVRARFVGIGATHTRVIRDGGRAPRTTAAVTSFDAQGMPVSRNDQGDQSVTGDEGCTLTDYTRNMDTTDGEPWLTSMVGRMREFAVDCTRAGQTGLTAAEVIADKKSYFDGATAITTPPTKGLVTKEETLDDWVNGAPVFVTGSAATYDEYGRPKSTTDVKNNVTLYSYAANAGGQVASATMTNALQWVNTVTYEPAFGVKLSQKDSNDRITSWEYDGLGRLTGVWQPGRDKSLNQTANVTHTYTVNQLVPSVISTSKLTPSGGYVTTYEYFDGLLRSIQTQAPRGDTTAGTVLTDTFYDTAGRVWKTYQAHLTTGTPGAGYVVANEQGDVPSRVEAVFDGAGRSIASVQYLKKGTGVPTVFATTTTGYGGDRVDVLPPTGGTATSTHTDARGNTTAVWRYKSLAITPGTPGSYDATTYTYTAKDQLSSVTDAAGNKWERTYNVRGQVLTDKSPDRGTVTVQINSAGEQEWVQNANGKVLYTYDSLSRKTAAYRTSISDANKLATWTYDGLTKSNGHLTKSVRYDGTNQYIKEFTGFTATYAPTGVKYTIPETGISGTFTYVYTYKPDGQPETVRLPDVDGTGGLALEALTTEYTPLGQARTLRTSLDNGTTYVTDTAYTGYGEIGAMTLQYKGGNTVTQERTFEDGTRRLEKQKVSRQTTPTTLSDVTFAYDTFGNVTGSADSVTNDNQCFRYDYLRRLTEAWTPATASCLAAPTASGLGGPAPYWTSWTFDASGNRRKQVERPTSTTVRTTDYVYPAAGGAQPHTLLSATTQSATGTTTASWTYDAMGNTTSRPGGTSGQTVKWDVEGHVISQEDSTGKTEYIYDADGERLVRRDPTGKTLFLPGQELRYTAGTGAKATTRYYQHAGTTVATRTTSGVTWICNDHQGTASITINATTQAYALRRQDPYGNPRGSVVGTWPASMDKGFVGGTKDNTGLTHLGAREYDPLIGRFISVDPVFDQASPQSFDGYSYAWHSPVSGTDTTGRQRDTTFVQWGATETGIYQGPDGYWYEYRIDRYVLCTKDLSECVARVDFGGKMRVVQDMWLPLWQIVINMFLNVPGYVTFKIFSFFTYRRLGSPQMPLPPPVSTPPTCLQVKEPPKKPKCSFLDTNCFVNDSQEWWKGNGHHITGAATMIGIAGCLAVPPSCATFGFSVGLVQAGGRTVDFVVENQDSDGRFNATAGETFQYLAGLAWDRWGGAKEEWGGAYLIYETYSLPEEWTGVAPGFTDPTALLNAGDDGPPEWTQFPEYSPFDINTDLPKN